MREILFRGKYDLLSSNRWKYLNPIELDDFDEVIPETVGQYTGLTYKNGTKIFEGDIVNVDVDKEFHFNGVYVVTWCQDSASFYLLENEKRDGRKQCVFTSLLLDVSKVIGNIHDNPELLK